MALGTGGCGDPDIRRAHYVDLRTDNYQLNQVLCAQKGKVHFPDDKLYSKPHLYHKQLMQRSVIFIRPPSHTIMLTPRIHLADYLAQVADRDMTCNGINWSRVPA